MKNLIIKGYGITDNGLIRPTNEDYYSIHDNLFMVADGLGGHNAGEIASKLTIESIEKDVKNFFQSNTTNNQSVVDYKNLIEKMIKTANQKVIHKAMKEPLYTGMGSTLVLALFQKPNQMHIANVGDSRAYLFRNKHLRIISEDHTLKKIMMNNFNLNNNEQQNNYYQNYLTRAVGININVEPYYTVLSLTSGDNLLLCSDGLWNMIEEKDIKNILSKNISNRLICQQLIKKAYESGGYDNITALVISIGTI